ncbi:hypothetical protein CIT292_09624 [Citrobacter youngae ATCC 29220]|uniref:Uncharacterized protein n=1 Tax=Citrobacter youngae ATCC 29220 TaxID=500640 RepID=D4BGH6_9ENTR|nr:hypothetical protein CIT292_09624 [Citrobacter youngae ATCC 29220]
MSSNRTQLSDLRHILTPFTAKFIPYSRITNNRSKNISLPRHKS